MSRIRMTERIPSSITAQLDEIAGDLEKIDLRVALAVDRVSDRLEGREAYGAFKEIKDVDAYGVQQILAAAESHHWTATPGKFAPSEKSYVISQRGKTTSDISIEGQGGKFEVSYNSGNPEAVAIIKDASGYAKTIKL